MRSSNSKTITLSEPRTLRVLDGTETTSKEIIQMAQIRLDIEGHDEFALLFVPQFAHFDIVLGLPWLQLHDRETNGLTELIYSTSSLVNLILINIPCRQNLP